jgi:hypothetical protein
MNIHSLFGAAAMASILVFGPAGGAAAEPVPLQPQEVRAMYSGNTWVWDEGAGYFAPNGTFQAWTRDGEYGLMHATGRWFVEIGGQLCYSARWFYQNTSSTSQDCFAHHVSNGSILQRDERNRGQWYVFGRRDAAGAVTARGLQSGNLVAPHLPARAAVLQ